MVFMRYIAIFIALFDILNAMSLSDINKATKDELMKIKGVGDSKANSIISARPFKSMQELDNVKGVGEVLLGNIQHDIFKKSSTNNSIGVSKSTRNVQLEDEPKRKKANVIHFEK